MLVAGIPAVVYLAAALMFVWSYRPNSAAISLDLPDEIEAARQHSLNHRHRWNLVALAVLVRDAGFDWNRPQPDSNKIVLLNPTAHTDRQLSGRMAPRS